MVSRDARWRTIYTSRPGSARRYQADDRADILAGAIGGRPSAADVFREEGSARRADDDDNPHKPAFQKIRQIEIARQTAMDNAEHFMLCSILQADKKDFGLIDVRGHQVGLGKPQDNFTAAARLRVEQPASVSGVGTYTAAGFTVERDAYIIPLGAGQTWVDLTD